MPNGILSSSFKKKYRGAWDVTWVAMHEEFKRIDTLIGLTNIAETIAEAGNIRICKTEFSAARNAGISACFRESVYRCSK